MSSEAWMEDAGSREVSRVHALWERREERSVLTVTREDWVRLNTQIGVHVPLQITATPMSAIASTASILAVSAIRSANGTAEIGIYRWDEKDQPTPVNKDTYVVWDVPSSNDTLRSCIAAAAVSDTTALREYVFANVFLIKTDPGPDHWLKCLPEQISAMLGAHDTGPHGK